MRIGEWPLSFPLSRAPKKRLRKKCVTTCPCPRVLKSALFRKLLHFFFKMIIRPILDWNWEFGIFEKMEFNSEVRPRRELMNPNFEGYKLSLRNVPTEKVCLIYIFNPFIFVQIIFFFNFCQIIQKLTKNYQKNWSKFANVDFGQIIWPK